MLCQVLQSSFCSLAAGVNIFRPTTFYIIVQTSFGLQMEIQLVPIMQVYITVDVTHKQNLLGVLVRLLLYETHWSEFTRGNEYITGSPDRSWLGLCGNFNGIQIDDFTTMSGSREGTGVGFANSWRTRATCPEVKNTFENPCSLSVENGTSSFSTQSDLKLNKFFLKKKKKRWYLSLN